MNERIELTGEVREKLAAVVRRAFQHETALGTSLDPMKEHALRAVLKWKTPEK